MIIITECEESGESGSAECGNCGTSFHYDVHTEEGLTDRSYPPLQLECPHCKKTNSEMI